MLDSNTTALPAQTRFDSTSSLNSSHTSNPPAPYLPTEILRGIVINSDLKTIAAFRGASRRLRDIVDDLNMVDLEQILENGAHEYHKAVIANPVKNSDFTGINIQAGHKITKDVTELKFKMTVLPKFVAFQIMLMSKKFDPQTLQQISLLTREHMSATSLVDLNSRLETHTGCQPNIVAGDLARYSVNHLNF